MKRISGERHNVGTYLINKINLSCFDDKKFILSDEINTLTYGHKDIVDYWYVFIIVELLLLLNCYYC